MLEAGLVGRAINQLLEEAAPSARVGILVGVSSPEYRTQARAWARLARAAAAAEQARAPVEANRELFDAIE